MRISAAAGREKRCCWKRECLTSKNRRDTLIKIKQKVFCVFSQAIWERLFSEWQKSERNQRRIKEESKKNQKRIKKELKKNQIKNQKRNQSCGQTVRYIRNGGNYMHSRVVGRAVMLLTVCSLLTGCAGNVSSDNAQENRNEEVRTDVVRTDEGTQAAANSLETGMEQQGKGQQNGSQSDGQGKGQQNGSQADGQGTGLQNGSQPDGQGTRSLEELLESWDFDYGWVTLSTAMKQLDNLGIHYAGYYNVSKERVDMTLEDGTSLIFMETSENGHKPEDYELMMLGDKFNGNGFQNNYLDIFDRVTFEFADEYYYPDLSDYVMPEQDLWTMNQTDLSIARNQIFARYGRKFEDAFLDAVFREKSWYEPLYTGTEFDARQQEFLTETDKENLKNIIALEKERNYRSTGDYKTARGFVSGSWIDLDGDGQEEQVLYDMEMTEQDLGVVTLKVRRAGEDGRPKEEEAAVVQMDAWNPSAVCYLYSMDGQNPGIFVEEFGMSADYCMTFFGYQQNTLTEQGRIASYSEGLKIYPGYLEAPVETWHFQCQPVNLQYKLVNGKLKQQEMECYTYRQNRVTAQAEISLYSEKNGTKLSCTLAPGDEVKVLGGDLEEWVLLEKTATGERGWLRVIGCECYQPDGTSEMSDIWFEGLTFYG